MKSYKKKYLPIAIIISIIAAIAVGLIFSSNPDIIGKYIEPVGTIYINLLKFIVVPIVFLSVTTSITSLGNAKKIMSLSYKVLLIYLVTTFLASVIGISVSMFFRDKYPLLDTSTTEFNTEPFSVSDAITNIFPSNLFEAMHNANMMQIIFIALIIGISIVSIGKKALPFLDVINSANEVFSKIMEMIILFSPVGVFCLLCNSVAINGNKIFGSLLLIIAVTYFAFILQFVLVYFPMVKFIANTNFIKFLKFMSPAMIFAFSTSSSLATLPLTQECVEKLGVEKKYSRFMLPLGATINMDGAAIYMATASVFIAASYGIDITFSMLFSICMASIVASIGSAGVTGSAVVILSVVLQSAGIPIEGIGLIFGIDKIFDMGRTMLNITGDAACALTISKIETKRK